MLTRKLLLEEMLRMMHLVPQEEFNMNAFWTYSMFSDRSCGCIAGHFENNSITASFRKEHNIRGITDVLDGDELLPRTMEHFLFSALWSISDNSVEGAIKRIEYLIKYDEVPDNFITSTGYRVGLPGVIDAYMNDIAPGSVVNAEKHEAAQLQLELYQVDGNYIAGFDPVDHIGLIDSSSPRRNLPDPVPIDLEQQVNDIETRMNESAPIEELALSE